MMPASLQDREIEHDRENRLWAEYRQASRSSRRQIHSKLVEFYLPLVTRIIERISMRVRERVEREELLSAGVIGLHAAISNFTREKGNSFSAFARKRIHGAIIDELRNQDPLTRGQRQSYRQICATIRKLTEMKYRSPTTEEIAAEIGLSESEVTMYMGMGSRSIKLDDEYRDGLTYKEMLADKRAENPVDAADRSIALSEMREAFRCLDDRDQKLLFLRHHEAMKVKEIASILGISEGRISQIYKEIIVKLRVIMKIHLET